MGAIRATRDWKLCCFGHRGKRTWPRRHATPLPRCGVHACHDWRSRLATTDHFDDFVTREFAEGISARGRTFALLRRAKCVSVDRRRFSVGWNGKDRPLFLSPGETLRHAAIRTCANELRLHHP